MPVTGVATAAIAEQQQPTGIRVMLAAMPLPLMGDTVTAKFAGVVAGVEVKKAFVPSHIIKAVRNHFAFAGTGKIMVQRNHLGLRIGVAFAGKVTDQLLLLGVHADDRVTGILIRRFKLGNILKLRVPVRMVAQRLFLTCFALP